MERSDRQIKKPNDLIVRNGKAEGEKDLGLPVGWDRDMVVEALVREKGLSLPVAFKVAERMEEELINLKLEKVDEKLVANMVETKLLELGMDPDGCEDEEPDSLFDKGKMLLSENALRVLERRYLKKDNAGKPNERPEEMLQRVARVIAQADLEYDEKTDAVALEEEFYSMMEIGRAPV